MFPIRTSALLSILVPLFFISCTASNVQKTMKHGKNEDPPFIQMPLKEHTVPAGRDYSDYTKEHRDGPDIPGLYQGAVPQGMAYYEADDLMFISNYMYNGKPSSISVISMTDGSFKKVLWLYNPDGTPHTGHVGGIAVSKTHLWIASGKGVYRTDFTSVENLENGNKLQMTRFIPTAVKGSFAAYAEGILWVGEFTSKSGSYSAPDSHHVKTNHGWLAGYILDSSTDCILSANSIEGLVYPDLIISIPDEVQGAAFFNDILVLSLSYGRRNKSRLVSYHNPLAGKIDTAVTLSDGTTIPLAVLDDSVKIHLLFAPPMTEGLVNYKNSIAVLFESGSEKYRKTTLFPQGKIQIFNIKFFRK